MRISPDCDRMVRVTSNPRPYKEGMPLFLEGFLLNVMSRVDARAAGHAALELADRLPEEERRPLCAKGSFTISADLADLTADELRNRHSFEPHAPVEALVVPEVFDRYARLGTPRFGLIIAESLAAAATESRTQHDYYLSRVAEMSLIQ